MSGGWGTRPKARSGTDGAELAAGPLRDEAIVVLSGGDVQDGGWSPTAGFVAAWLFALSRPGHFLP